MLKTNGDISSNLTLFYPDQKDIILPINDELVLEISWELDSSEHFDDQLQVFSINNRIIGLIIADGVSNSSGGRIASVYLNHYIPLALSAALSEREVSGFELQNLGMEAINYAVKKLAELKLNSEKTFLSDSKRVSHLVKFNHQMKELNVFLEDLSNLSIQLKKFLANHGNFVNEFKLLLEQLDKQGYSITLNQEIITKLTYYRESLQNSTRYLSKTKLQLSGVWEDIMSELAGLVDREYGIEIKENIDSIFNLINSAKKAYSNLIGIIDGQNNNYQNSDFEKPDFLTPETGEKILSRASVIKNLLLKIQETLPLWFKLVLQNLNETNEDGIQVFDNLRRRLNLREPVECESTLAFILLEIIQPQEDDESSKTRPVRFWSYILGDPEVYLFTSDKQWIAHYKTSEGKLKSFISSIRSTEGRMDLCQRYLGLEDLLIMGSDGANLKWTPKGGYAFVPFLRLINAGLNGSNSTAGIPTKWQEYLSLRKAITDDFSLITAWIRKKKYGERKL